MRPGVNFTTDVMTGFPGETEEEFGESCETVEKAQFGSIHVFPYSKREGTPAAEMEGQVDEHEKAPPCRCYGGYRAQAHPKAA